MKIASPDINVSLHNHSNWSDGANSMEEMCISAREHGLKTFGMSDHFVLAPGDGYNEESWSMKIQDLPKYMEEIHRLQKKYNSNEFTILAGVEADFFFENFEDSKKIISQYPFDYVIGSVHYAGKFPIDCSIDDWKDLSQQQIDNIWKIYWDKLEGAIRTGFYSFIGHLDLPKKFGYKPSESQLPGAIRALKAAKEMNMPVEINTAGWHKQCNEEYPAPAMIRHAVNMKVPLLINSDAHDKAHVNRDFEKAQQLLAICSGELLA